MGAREGYAPRRLPFLRMRERSPLWVIRFGSLGGASHADHLRAFHVRFAARYQAGNLSPNMGRPLTDASFVASS
jgi:hypothetical protein